MFTKLKQTFIGRPLKSLTEGEGGLLGKMQALAMLSSDALSSIAYGPEQVVLVLTILSPLAIWWSLPIGLFVLLLLASLTVSYRQIIHAYPQGGGAYMVTRENLSPELGLIAGGSLLVDYMLGAKVGSFFKKCANLRGNIAHIRHENDRNRAAISRLFLPRDNFINNSS